PCATSSTRTSTQCTKLALPYMEAGRILKGEIRVCDDRVGCSSGLFFVQQI
ncbi:hypothetical protein HDU92_000684, partial [Lobulomyces angularis]